MRARAARYGRELRFGYRAHVIVRATEQEARAAAQRLVSRLDDATGEAIRRRSLDTTSAGTRRQNELRDTADQHGYAEPNLWTGIGRARSGAGAAIVGDPDQVLAKLHGYLNSAWKRSSCRAIRTRPKPTCSRGMCFRTWTTARCSRGPPPPFSGGRLVVGLLPAGRLVVCGRPGG